MEKKELIKLYLQNVDKMFGYANMNAYIDERLKKYTKYCQSKARRTDYYMAEIIA